MKKILHVDDLSAYRQYARRELGSRYEVSTAASIEEANTLLKQTEFDLEIWDGSIAPGENADGARIAVTRKALGRNILIFSSGKIAEDLAREHGIPFVNKGEGGLLEKTVRKLLADRGA